MGWHGAPRGLPLLFSLGRAPPRAVVALEVFFGTGVRICTRRAHVHTPLSLKDAQRKRHADPPTHSTTPFPSLLQSATLEIPFSVPPYMSLLARSVATLEGIALVGDENYQMVSQVGRRAGGWVVGDVDVGGCGCGGRAGGWGGWLVGKWVWVSSSAGSHQLALTACWVGALTFVRAG